MMDKHLYFLKLARRTLTGQVLDAVLLRGLLATPEEDLLPFCAGADLPRETHFGRTVHLCVIRNGKSGRCSEDCSFCSQSIRATTDAAGYPLQSVEERAAPGKRLEGTPVNRYFGFFINKVTSQSGEAAKHPFFSVSVDVPSFSLRRHLP